MAEEKPARRPISPRRVGAPETTEEDARTREPTEPDEKDTRPSPRVRQIHGGEVHWFSGGGLVRETR